jgi:hypothetical protein
MDLYREFFFLFVLFLIAFGLMFERSSKNIFAFFSLIYFIFIILKPIGAYPDDKSYLDLLMYFRNDDLPEINAGRDFIFYYFTYIISFFSSDRIALNLVVIVSVAIKLFVIARMTNFSMLAFAFFVSLSSQIADLTTIRNSLATAFIYLLIYFIIRKEFKKSLFTYIVSIFTHLNTLLYIPAVLILNKYLYSLRYLMVASAFAFSFSNFSVVGLNATGIAVADLYLTQLGSDVVVEISRLRVSVVAILLMIFWLDYKAKRKPESFWLFQGALLSQISPMLFFWFPNLAGRFADLMLPFLILYVGHRLSDLTLHQRIAIAIISSNMIVNYMYVNPLYLRDSVMG